MKLQYLALVLSATVALQASAFNAFEKDDKVVDPDSTGFTFTDVTVVKSNPVRDQNKSGTCWSFSTNTFLEDEILKKTGREVDLSEMFVVRQCYLDKADKYVRMHGETNFAAGGAANDVLYVWKRYGMMPEEAYTGLNYGEDKHVHGELDAVLKAYLDGIIANPNKRLSTAWRKGYEAILDAYLGPVPSTFTVDGKTYTPKSYAESLGINPDDYVSITSFLHHPMYEQFVLEIPDNWLWEPYYNVALDEMKQIVDNAIDNGYPIAWGADVSEGGFKWKLGYAVIPAEKDTQDMSDTELARWVHLSDKDRLDSRYDIKGPVKEIEVTPQSRQEMFDRFETTDDHGMVIIGKAVDQEGNRYYKVQNSWDTNQVYDGFFYVSEPYFLAKTMDIMVNRKAVPTEILRKLKL